jgi:hypothetical protein
MFRGRWVKASVGEQNLMAAVACASDDSGLARVGDVAALLGVPTTGVSRPRKSLIDKGVLEPGGFGLLRFTMPGFAEYVLGVTGLSRLGASALASGAPASLRRLGDRLELTAE